jgi:hypothetical protein
MKEEQSKTREIWFIHNHFLVEVLTTWHQRNSGGKRHSAAQHGSVLSGAKGCVQQVTLQPTTDF